mgnify:FL=1
MVRLGVGGGINQLFSQLLSENPCRYENKVVTLRKS